MLPFGALLLTQYTITGFDACAHLSEETREASMGAAKGVWKAIFYSAIGGWILLLCFLFAATNVDAINKNPFGYIVIAVFQTSLGLTAFKIVMIISTVGQFFCAGSGMTSASRMTYAFSRDHAIPGWKLWSKVTASKAPRNATMFIAFCVRDRRDPGAQGQRRQRADRLLRADGDHGDRALPRVR